MVYSVKTVGHFITNTKRFMVIVTLLILIYTGLFTAVFYTVSKIIKDKNIKDIQDRIMLIKETVAIFDHSTRISAEKLSHIFFDMFVGDFLLDTHKTVNVNGVDTPALLFNKKPLNLDFKAVDKFTAITKGSVATIFVKKDDDFVRIATSLKKEDYTRSIGTFLGKFHPAYDNMINGRQYIGMARLFGRDYVTCYKPIKDYTGQTVGILFVGHDITDKLKSLIDKLALIKLDSKSYFFIYDLRKVNSQNIFFAYPTDNRIVQEIVSKKEGITIYRPFDGHVESLLDSEKLFIYCHYKNWGWILGICVDNNYIENEIIIIRNVLIVYSLIAVVIIGVLLFIIVSSHDSPQKHLH